jgi:hypothetical protein
MVTEKNMSEIFIDQDYLIIESNVVTNIVTWNGNTNIWTPPQGSIALVVATTPAMIWELNADNTAYVLTEVMGAGQIGFTWDGTVLTVNQPKPIIKEAAPDQPTTTLPQA